MIFENNFLLFNYSTIGFSFLISLSAFLIVFFIFKHLKKYRNSVSLKLLKTVFAGIISISALLGISAFIFKRFREIVLFSNKFINIRAFDIYLILLVLLISFILSKVPDVLLFKHSKNKNKKVSVKKKGTILIKYLIWTIGLSVILKIILTNAVQPANYILFNISETEISVFDIFFLTIIFAVTSLTLMALRKFFQNQSEKGHIDQGNAEALYKIMKYVIAIIAIIISLQSAGFNLSILLAGSAALLVGFGMGIQNIFADIVSGFILLLERPLKTTDIIEVDGIVGKVKNIGIRTTTLYTRDDTIIRVPNSKFTLEKIVNWSDIKNNTRFKVNVGVAYGSDIELVMNCLRGCAEAHKKTANFPKPFVRFEEFGESSLSFSIFFWSSENMRIENIKSDIRVCIDKEFRENDIKIPFPQRDLHMIK